MTFEIPTKRIISSGQLEDFQSSQTHANIVTFVEQLNESAVNVKLTDSVETTRIHPILDALAQVESIAMQTPPVDNEASRFGNPAFRTFYDKVEKQAPILHAGLGVPEAAIPELQAYFVNSWGNRERIDYGSGMELNFLCWLYCLRQLGTVDERDHRSLVIRVFWRYIQVMRVLQSTYWLEPAGSHGVWGLDDYHFLPFLFGSAQLRTTSTGPAGRRAPGHPSPKAIHVPDIVDELAKEYMYFACIKFINSIKTASLRWHSPMLDDISAVKTWDKVNAGMVKMYKAEVLGKLPVVQHFLFGSILPYSGRPPPGSSEDADPHRDHAHQGWGDCCGIHVPSAFAAAAQEEGARARVIEGPGIRPIPFD